jgi:hypothetical protein
MSLLTEFERKLREKGSEDGGSAGSHVLDSEIKQQRSTIVCVFIYFVSLISSVHFFDFGILNLMLCGLPFV